MVMKRGAIKEAIAAYGISKRIACNIWAEGKSQLESGNVVMFTNKKFGRHIERDILNASTLSSIPVEKRTTIRRVARELSVSKSAVGRWVKSGVIRHHNNAIKLELTPHNSLQRINWCLNNLHMLDHPKIKFTSMKNIIHIDEKWFYMTKETGRYYLLPGEAEPHRTCKSKRFIPKVMFLCAVTRPRFSEEGDCLFDGKIGIWPFTTTEPAKRNSKNRQKGTLVTKPIESITKDVIKGCIINQVIPQIKRMWPLDASTDIFIQQDNAKPHISDDDPAFRLAARADGFNIMLVCQPPNSPDMNVNDLGWFRAIQSLQVDTSSYNVDDLVRNVVISFEKLTSATLNNVFLTLQGCLVEVLRAKGTNNYKIPHMGKDRLIREGALPETLEVEESLVRNNIDLLMQTSNVFEMKYNIKDLMTDLGY